MRSLVQLDQVAVTPEEHALFAEKAGAVTLQLIATHSAMTNEFTATGGRGGALLFGGGRWEEGGSAWVGGVGAGEGRRGGGVRLCNAGMLWS